MPSLIERLQAAKKKSTVKVYLLGEQIIKIGRKLDKLSQKQNKSAKDEEQIQQLQHMSHQMVEEQTRTSRLNKRMGIVERILLGYFAYKITTELFKSLTMDSPDHNINGNYSPSIKLVELPSDPPLAASLEDTDEYEKYYTRGGQSIAISRVTDELADMSKQAQEMGITADGELPLLTVSDEKRLRDLANIAKDYDSEQMMEQYAAKCQELGLDYAEAKNAFESGKTINEVSNEVEKDIEQQYIAEQIRAEDEYSMKL